jgi:predicted MPP superfamily phosphohydrolase
MDDLWAARLNLPSMAQELASGRPSIALCHNPDGVDLPGWAGYQGWILSGHTHGGQCKPPFLPPPILPVKNRRYTAGAFDLWDGRWLYVNRGLGHLLRVRFGVRPEVTAFRLQAV